MTLPEAVERVRERMARAIAGQLGCTDTMKPFPCPGCYARADAALFPELLALIEAAVEYGNQAYSGGTKDHVFPLHSAALHFTRSLRQTESKGK